MYALMEGVVSVLGYFVLIGQGALMCQTAWRDTAGNAMPVAIRGTELAVDANLFTFRYDIVNDSDHDIWVFAGWGQSSFLVTPSFDPTKRVLALTGRLELPARGFGHQAPGRYVRLRRGQKQTESISFPLPFWVDASPRDGAQAEKSIIATRLVLTIGYYKKDLPQMIDLLFSKSESLPGDDVNSYARRVASCLGGRLAFNERNELLRDRNNEVMLLNTHQVLQGEEVLQIALDDVQIPCRRKHEGQGAGPIDLRPCTRIDILYEPSMMDYFFPFEGQQNLLTEKERDYLRSGTSLTLSDRDSIQALTDELEGGFSVTAVARRVAAASIVCSYDDGTQASFMMENDDSISLEGGYRLKYPEGLSTLRKCTPGVEAIAFRVGCAANLMDQWHRLCLYSMGGTQRRGAVLVDRQRAYPEAMQWCDGVVRYCESIGMEEYYISRPFICPGVISGKCHYAMNSDCRVDSSGDTVLLYETKTGWNQHGGSELFTFDNHNPKGGCVLLNDGKVKFIRTEEELKQLRWK